MKRFTLGAMLFVVALLTVFAGVAEARWSDPQPITFVRQRSWLFENATAPVYYAVNGPRADTLWTVGADSKADTTAAFNLLDCDVPNLNQFGVVVTANDSIPFAHIVFSGDSTVTNTVNFKAATAAVQVNWGSSKIGWTTIKTYTCAVTDGKKFWNIPLYNSGIVAVGEQSVIGLDGLQLDWQFAPAVRVIFTGTTSTSVPMMRCTLVKYRAPGAPAGGATTNF